MIEQEQKYTWLYEFEARVAEMMGKDMPRKEFPYDIELMMPDEHEDIYVKYLAAKIDYEEECSRNSREDAWADARAWYIRTHGSKNYGNWRV